MESRFFKIIYYLLERGKATAPELAEKFEVSVRTIYRDIDSLSNAGIPIYTTPGKGGGIFLLPEFVLNQSFLSQEEKKQIMLALQNLSVTNIDNLETLIQKLGGLFKLKTTNWIEVDFSDWNQNFPKQNNFNLLKEAILNQQVVKFSYFGNDGYSSNRIVEPIKLVFKNMNWYLYGFCRTRNDVRFFKLTRLKNLEILAENFICERINIPKTNFTLTKINTIPVTLKFSPEVAFRVYDEFTNQVIKDQQGNLIVVTEFPNDEIMYSYILSFGDNVEVIEPESIRNNLKERLSSLIKKYKT